MVGLGNQPATSRKAGWDEGAETMSLRVCSVPGCPVLCPGGKCPGCAKDADKARGTRQQRGYGQEHIKRFREGVLARDPICVICYSAPSTVADHYPLDKRELIEAGMDDHDPKHGRGLCAVCHNRHTAATQPGGFLIHE